MRPLIFFLTATCGLAAARWADSNGPAARTLQPSNPIAQPTHWDSALDQLHYRIQSTIDAPRHRFRGTSTVRFVNGTDKPLQQIKAHLYLNAFASDQTLFMKSSGGLHRGSTQGGPGWIHVLALKQGSEVIQPRLNKDQTVLTAALAHPVAPGASVSLAFEFEAQLPRVFARTGYARDFIMLAQWYPKLGQLNRQGQWHCPAFHAHSEFFGAFADYQVRLTLPSAYKVAATSTEPRNTQTDGTKQTLTFRARRVHDFAAAAWPGFVVSMDQCGPTRLTLYAAAAAERNRVRKMACFALAELDEWFGAYPYPRLSVVLPPRFAKGAHAMEYPTLITTWLPMSAPGLNAVDEVTVHEVVHQYLYGIVASNEVAEPWLDEGLTTYVTARLMSRYYGEHSGFIGIAGLRIDQPTKNWLHAATAAKPLPIGKAAAGYPDWQAYAATVYGRAGLVMHALETLLTRDRFDTALAAYVRANRFKHPTSRALERHLINAAQPDIRPLVEKLYQRTVYGTSEPPSIDYRIRCNPGSVRIESRDSLRLPLRLQVDYVDGTSQTHDLGDRTVVELQPYRSARLLPRELVWLDPTPLDTRCDRRREAAFAVGAGAVIGHLLQALL